ncbi:hypothetical protein P3T36_002986 [Kitasatospora sp. MAP12-15]|uniref:hypothetical protein n=1 Tax=unclassified Kitasatospora TaxID=2633591 RepID=UPI0024735C75|nr:hypothetical protein [Kitasatospora sp. MAP12-44]MDH6108855.1 hypothetical protein [Kitasatospora sp. MAP12-44]
MLGVWLIAVPLIPGTGSFRPSAFSELIGGNWTNIASAIGACIAAGAATAAHGEARKNRHMAERIHHLLTELHLEKESAE